MQNRVKEFRKKNELTQETLAEKSTVSRNTIYLIEAGISTNVTYDIMSKIAKALGEPVATIFFDK